MFRTERLNKNAFYVSDYPTTAVRPFFDTANYKSITLRLLYSDCLTYDLKLSVFAYIYARIRKTLPARTDLLNGNSAKYPTLNIYDG